MMKIVIIDDEAVICNGIKNMVENSGMDWEVYEIYTDAEEALEFCDWDRVDLLLSDINMPEIDGLTLVDTLKERGHDVQVIFISGYTEFKYAQKALQQKAIDYIIKPVSIKVLKEAINKTAVLIEQNKKNLRDEKFIADNISSITKSFIYDMLFETRRLSKQEIEESLNYCNLMHAGFSLLSFSYGHIEKIRKSLEEMNQDRIRAFLYTSKSNYNMIVVCEETDQPGKGDQVKQNLKDHYPDLKVDQTQFAESILELAQVNDQMMAQHKNDLAVSEASSKDHEQKVEVEKHENYSPHVVSAIQYIEEHYSKKISLSSLAEELYVHPTYLSNSFKKQTGTNIVDFINNHRIEVAKELLKDSRNKIYWVADRVGFANQRYFSQKFKKITGCTPVEYKQKVFFGS